MKYWCYRVNNVTQEALVGSPPPPSTEDTFPQFQIKPSAFSRKLILQYAILLFYRKNKMLFPKLILIL